jgi:hypothetical protein
VSRCDLTAISTDMCPHRAPTSHHWYRWQTAAVVVTALMAASCSANDPDTASDTATGSIDSSVAAKPENTGTATCRDPRGDGTEGDLKRVALTADPSMLTMRFVTGDPMPTKGTVLYSAQLWSTDGNTGYQLGVKFLNGRTIGHFVFDLVEAHQTNLTGDIPSGGTTMAAAFPVDELDGLGETFKWSATLSIGGDDVDTCPRPGSDFLHPKQKTFPDAGT